MSSRKIILYLLTAGLTLGIILFNVPMIVTSIVVGIFLLPIPRQEKILGIVTGFLSLLVPFLYISIAIDDGGLGSFAFALFIPIIALILSLVALPLGSEYIHKKRVLLDSTNKYKKVNSLGLFAFTLLGYLIFVAVAYYLLIPLLNSYFGLTL